MRVLLANEPALYREVVCAAFKELRPGVSVFTTEPEDLDSEFLRLSSQFVVCSRVTTLVKRDASAWVELYPDGTSRVIVGGLGRRSTLVGMNFATLLSILDNADYSYSPE